MDQFPHDDVDDRSNLELAESELDRARAMLRCAERGCRALRHELDAERAANTALEEACGRQAMLAGELLSALRRMLPLAAAWVDGESLYHPAREDIGHVRAMLADIKGAA